jgi:thiol-disulfide isomerase/thioredoxin
MKTNPAKFVFAVIALAAAPHCVSPGNAQAAPEFTQTDAKAWINSAPLTLESLRGRVVLIDFWAFECWNCYRSFPWLNSLEERFEGEEFTIVGVHSPEFEREKDIDSVRAKAREFDLKHPIMIDNDHSYWRAIGNHYWPAYYLVDRQGQIRDVFIGETHEGDERARQVEAAIEALL